MTADNANDAAHTITAADGTLVPVPQEFVCPLTLDIMSQPLLSREGHSYEQEAIFSWVAEHGTSPLTREPLGPAQLMRNRALETKIRLFLKQNGISEESTADKENATKFVGYVVSPKMSESIKSMSLRSMASITLELRPSESALEETNDIIEERRRQIANLIGGAMQELDEF